MKTLNRLSSGLFWGIPTLGRPVPLEWALSFKGMNPPINFNVVFSTVVGREVADARNAMARAALDADCKYIFFHGDDTAPPPHALKQLIFRMENQPNCGVVGGVYCSKCDPPAPLVFMGNGEGSYWDWKIGEFFECSGLGMDCTLIRVELLKELSQPWFKTVDTDKYLDGVNSAEQWTEDLYFCRKVLNETQWKIFCDTSVICDHWDVYNKKVYRLPKNSLPMRQMLVDADKPKCLMLGHKIDLTENQNFEIVWMTNDNNPDADYRGQFEQLPFGDKSFDWVIVSQPQVSVRAVDEWKRVAKTRISVNLDESLNRNFYARIWNGKIDGSFMELELEMA